MLTKENLKELLSIALGSGAEFADIFIEEKAATNLVCEDNKIEKISSGIQIGAGIRVICDKEVAYAAASDTSYGNLMDLTRKLALAIKGPNQPKPIILTPQVSIKRLLEDVKIRPNEVPIEQKKEQVEILNSTARSFGSSIKQVTASYTDINQAVTIANSQGKYIEDNRISTRYSINVIAEKNGILQTGYEAPGACVGFELFEKYPPKEYAQKCAQRALMMLDAPHAPSGKMMVVLSSTAGGTLIHEACGHALEADFIMKGTSVFKNKLGQRIASSIVTVIDDATLAERFGSFAYDDEGTLSQKTILIENGILKRYLTDHYTASFVNMSQSGNGRRESFRSRPQPRMTNTMIAPGRSDPQEIIASVKNGLLVKRMGGGQVDVTSGDFVFEVSEGYLIENGKIKHPVRGAILTGNGPHILETIDMVGTDLGFQTGVCGKYDHVPVTTAQPTIRIPQVLVGGQN